MNKNLYRVQKSMQNVGNILIIYIYIYIAMFEE